MPLDNSPYYIRTTSSLPEFLPVQRSPWLARLRHWVSQGKIAPNFTQSEGDRYRRDRTTGQVRATSDTYDTKLRANWAGGVRSNDMHDSTVTPAEWFPYPVGRPTSAVITPNSGQSQGPLGTPIGASVNRPPLPAPYKQLHSGDMPNLWAGSIPSEWQFHQGRAPWRVPLPRKPGISLMAGPRQFATQQHAAGLVSSVVVAPPTWSNPTRGARSVSGIFGRVQSPGRTRVPAVYVPTQVR